MRSKLVIALLALGLVVASHAEAQVFGQYLGAETLPVNGRLFGAYVHSSEHVAGLLSQLRLSFYPGMDFGFRGGFARRNRQGNDRTTLRLGGDIKIAVQQPSDSSSISLAAGADVGVETGDNFHLLTFGPSLVASRKFTMGQGGVVPYAGIGLAFTNIDISSSGSRHDNEFSVPIRIGSDFQINNQLGLALEMQIQAGGTLNNHFGLAGGINIPF